MADDNTPAATDEVVEPTDDAPVTPPVDKPLGETGKRALDAERRNRQAAERRARDAEAELERIRQASLTDQERAVQDAAEAARTDERAKSTHRLFAAEVRAAVAGKVADPDLFSDPVVAKRLLRFDAIPLADDGEIDSEAISHNLAELLAAKPHLAASATRPIGSADQGARTPPPPAPDLETQIHDAEANRDWPTARRLKTQRLAALARG
jgi:hypothetical protein